MTFEESWLHHSDRGHLYLQLPCRKGTCKPFDASKSQTGCERHIRRRKSLESARLAGRTKTDTRLTTHPSNETDSERRRSISAIRAALSSRAIRAATSHDEAAVVQQADTDTIATAATRHQTTPIASGRRRQRAAAREHSDQRRRIARASIAMRCSMSSRARMMRRWRASWAKCAH